MALYQHRLSGTVEAMKAIIPIAVSALLAMGLANAEERPETVSIPAGTYIVGSSPAEREMAYRLDEVAYGHSVTRQNKWYDDEPPPTRLDSPSFKITRTLITNAQYAAFIAATGRPAPDVTPRVWRSYRLIHPYERTRRHAWRDGKPPAGRDMHPVVLVSHKDAVAYAIWLSQETDATWRLPTEREWERRGAG